MRLALFEPEYSSEFSGPSSALAACLGAPLDINRGPAAFPLDDKRILPRPAMGLLRTWRRNRPARFVAGFQGADPHAGTASFC